jgi:broad specificity phosphatase PhoE
MTHGVVRDVEVQDFVLIRHAETWSNRLARWHGDSDEPISPKGRQESERAARKLVATLGKPRLLITSRLVRAVQTAQIFSASLPGADLVKDNGLREREMGDWSGLGPAEVEARWPGMLSAWERGELAGPPNGETDFEVAERAMRVLRQNAGKCPGPVLVVTHGGVIRSLLRTNGRENLPVPHLGGYRTKVKQSGDEWWITTKVAFGDPHVKPRT